jgi:hypothetical protein
MTEQDILQLGREDLACYAFAVDPNFELAAHHRLMVDNLEAVERGEISRSMICMPPRHGKTSLGTEKFAAWFLGRNPGRSIITSSYGQELVEDFGRKVRNLVINPVHRAIFPEFRLAQDTSMRRFSTTAGGSYYAVGRGGAITGRGAHLLLIDDPLKDAEEARSEVTRRALHEWFKSVAYTRLQPGGAVILISTRWHEDDLAGHLLREDPTGWDVLSLPAIADISVQRITWPNIESAAKRPWENDLSLGRYFGLHGTASSAALPSDASPFLYFSTASKTLPRVTISRTAFERSLLSSFVSSLRNSKFSRGITNGSSK